MRRRALVGAEDVDWVRQRLIGWTLPYAKDAPNLHSPYNAPMPEEEFQSLPERYRQCISYEWTGDLFAMFELHRSIDHGYDAPEWTNLASDARIVLDGGVLWQLKNCGFITVYNGQCPISEREALDRMLQTIDANSKRVWAAVGALLDGVAAVVSFIPVVGQAVAVVLTMAAAIATQRPIDGSFILNGLVAAVPGGALAKTTVLSGVETAKKLIDGKGVDEAALAGLRQAAYEISPSVGSIFDLAVAVARGEDLQEIGFAVISKWLPGTGIDSKVTRFGLRMVQAAARGESIQRVLLREASVELRALPVVQKGQAEVDRGVKALLAEPRHYLGSIEAFASTYAMPIEAARAAFMSVDSTVNGLRENANFRSVLIDPATPIADEARMAETTRRWVQRKIPLAELTFQEAERTMQDKYLAAKPPAGIFDPRGKTLVVSTGPALEVVSVNQEFERLKDQIAFQTIREKAVAAATATRDIEGEAEYSPGVERLGIATIASWNTRKEG